jgi:hypothetical protein
MGESLPVGGGEPGAAYLAWVSALHAFDIVTIQTLVTLDLAQILDDPEADVQLKFLATRTPTDARIIEGSSNGLTVTLQVEGSMDGESVTGGVTLDRIGEQWIATSGTYE